MTSGSNCVPTLAVGSRTDAQRIGCTWTRCAAGKASTGIEPVQTDSRGFVQHFIFDSPELRDKVALYADHFEEASQ